MFLLHDVFGYPHQQIADMLGRSHAAVRRLASRARKRLAEDRPRYEDAARRHEVADAFMAATAGQDLDRLMELLAPDVVLASDGGGVVSATRRPVHGADRVARFLLGVVRQAHQGAWTLVPVEINGQPGFVADHYGEIDTALALHIKDGRVEDIHAVRNPDKLVTIRRQMSASPHRNGRQTPNRSP